MGTLLVRILIAMSLAVVLAGCTISARILKESLPSLLQEDTVSPTIQGLVLNGNQSTAGGNVLSYTLTATDNVGVTAYRFSNTTDFSNSIWEPATDGSFTFPYAIGSSVATLYAQVKDAAGNISTASVSNSVNITMGAPPNITLIRPVTSGVYTSTPMTVNVAWKITTPSGNALVSNGVNVTYSLNNGATQVPWPSSAGSNLSTGQNGGCSLAGGATGCVDLALPPALVNQKFYIIVTASDVATNSAAAISVVQNTAGLTLLAGKNSAVLGQTGLAYALGSYEGIGRDPVNGDLYLLAQCQILILEASTGIIKNWAGDPNSCTHAGNGGTLANVRFQGSHYPGGGGGGSGILVDSQRNIYWASRQGIWKYNRSTGNAAIYAGQVNSPFTTTTGTNRLSFGCGSIDNGDCTNAFLQLGLNDTLYITVITSWDPNAMKIYRVESNDTITHVAGYSNDPMPIPYPTPGDLATNVGFNFLSVFPDSATSRDRVYGVGWGGTGGACVGGGTCTFNGLWEVQQDGTVQQVSTVYPYNYGILSRYLPSRKAFAFLEYVSGAPPNCRVRFFNPADPSEVISPMSYPSDGCNLIDIVDDGHKGLYFATEAFQHVYYASAASVPAVYTGISTGSGDGNLATLAELRQPTQVTMDTGGNYYLIDSGNSKLRKIDTSGNMSLIKQVSYNASGISFSTGSGPVTYVTDPTDSQFGTSMFLNINNLAAGDAFFRGTIGSQPFVCDAASAANAVSDVTMNNDVTSYIYNMSVAVDGTDTYVLMTERKPNSTIRGFIKKIAASGAMTTVAGSSTFNSLPQPNMVAGTQVGSSNIGSAGGPYSVPFVSPMKVSGGVIFKSDTDKALYSVDSSAGTNTWAQEVTGLRNAAFAIDQSTKNMYYFKGLILYRKAYGGAETALTDFTGTFSNPWIQMHDTSNPNSLVIVDGNSVYLYTNATEIP